ncbi:bone morphogenetic protein 1 homolog [Zootermopsis nevadensis]|uniref:Membrane frizzled-related protein n=1 Tax=Zootermopsis nevadensis TaxID=136037 RepID=A0A067QE57_ZOONE|nr:bone morphogenetic protein 1 homolog [Zootermopsis nevadensis]KDQ71477.1 Membrane frizzled-related protein [Zootermopsis nevadensis]
MIYSAGRGCGGRLFNYGGVFTSPMYPVNYRNSSHCRWDVSVPVGTQPVLKFTVFDIGPQSTCDSDFVELYDVDTETNAETFMAKYCGEVSGGITCLYLLTFSSHVNKGK